MDSFAHRSHTNFCLSLSVYLSLSFVLIANVSTACLSIFPSIVLFRVLAVCIFSISLSFLSFFLYSFLRFEFLSLFKRQPSYAPLTYKCRYWQHWPEKIPNFDTHTHTHTHAYTKKAQTHKHTRILLRYLILVRWGKDREMYCTLGQSLLQKILI